MSDLMRDWIEKNDWDIGAVKMEQFPFCPENYTLLPIGVRAFLLGEAATTLPKIHFCLKIMTSGFHVGLLDWDEKNVVLLYVIFYFIFFHYIFVFYFYLYIF